MAVAFNATIVTTYGGDPPSIVRPQGWHVFSAFVTLAAIANDVSDGVARMHCVVAPSKVGQQVSALMIQFLTNDGIQSRIGTPGGSLRVGDAQDKLGA